jgi:transposase
MAARFVNIDHDTPLMLPPNMRDWVPKDHLIHFILDVVKELDLSSAKINHRGTGDKQYPPEMLLGLLVFSYATGVFSSRQIEKSTYENVPVRVLCADTHPDHDTICNFRSRNKELLTRSFSAVLEMSARCGVLKVGGITVAIDGTKVLANASKHSAVSYAHAGETLRQLDLEVAELLKKAEDADSTPLEDGLSIPEEVQRRQERKAMLAKARTEMEARARVRAEAEMDEYQTKVEARKAKCEEGKKPRGSEPKPPEETPGPKDQYNFTDPESRIMKAGNGQHFEQSYNAQAAVEVDSRLITGQRVSVAPNDKEQLEESVKMIDPAVGSVAEVLIDSGFVSEKAVNQVETDDLGNPTGIVVIAAIKREGHGRSVQDLEKHADPEPPSTDAPFTEKMAYRVKTKSGRARYKLRQQTVEPVFGIIKETLGFRRFSLRGKEKVSLEWTLVTLAYNLKRLFTIGAKLKIA